LFLKLKWLVLKVYQGAISGAASSAMSLLQSALEELGQLTNCGAISVLMGVVLKDKSFVNGRSTT
jgi:hypothetical protein